MTCRSKLLLLGLVCLVLLTCCGPTPPPEPTITYSATTEVIASVQYYHVTRVIDTDYDTLCYTYRESIFCISLEGR